MFWLPISLALVLSASGTSVNLHAPEPVNTRLLAAYWGDQPSYDPQAERDLLDLANRARDRAGLPPFQMDEGLTQAAREHATAMALRQQLSHQFSGEPALSQRLAANCKLYLVEAAENVASAESADRAHDALMHSPPHRENLLHPSYNAIGIGIVRRGDDLYVVEDFGHSLPAYSAEKAEDIIADSVARKRDQAHLPLLQRDGGAAAQKDACAMGAADSIKPGPESSHSARAILRYTSTQPEILPPGADEAIANSGLRTLSVGSCFVRTKTYPNGIYWIVLLFN